MNKQNTKIMENLVELENNFYNKTSFEVIEGIRLEIMAINNNFYNAGENLEEVELLSKINELLNKYLRG